MEYNAALVNITPETQEAAKKAVKEARTRNATFTKNGAIKRDENKTVESHYPPL